MPALNGHHAVRVGGAGYASLVLGMGPAGYWRLADTGATAAAVAGPAGAYSGTFSTGHLSAIGRESATAARFGGGAMSVTIPSISPPITAAVWAKLDGSGTNSRHAIDLRGSGVSVLAYRSGVPDLFARGTGGGVPTPQPVMAPLIGEWALYAGVLTGSQAVAYRNGIMQNTSAFSAAAAFTSVRIASAPTGDPAHGDYCEAMVFSRALSAAELLTLYLAGINGA